MNLLETLIHPDREDDPQKALVALAANLLQIGEFQLLQLAWADWQHGDMPEGLIDRLFAEFMIEGKVPFWALDYARRIVALEETGDLDDLNPAYHRFDSNFHTYVPDGVRRFIWATCFVTVFIVGAVLLAEYSGSCPGATYPPCVDMRDIRPTP